MIIKHLRIKVDFSEQNPNNIRMSADVTTVKKGPVSVRIYHYLNKGHKEYKVEDYTQGKRRLITRSTLKKAREKAGEIA